MDQQPEQITTIEPRRSGADARLSELVEYRSFYRFLFKEIMIRRWRNTLLGAWWLIIRPLVPATMAVIAFTFIVPMPSYGLPYPIFYLSGFIAWTAFHATVTFVPRTMLMMRAIMKRSYFPRLLVPLAGIGPALIEITVSIVLFLIALAFFGIERHELFLRLDWGLMLFPLCVIMAIVFALAIGIVASIAALFVRDVIFTVPYFASVLMFLTPVIYPVTFVPESTRWIFYLLNPMAKIVETARWSLTGEGGLEPFWLLVSCGTIAGLFLASAWFFMRVETVMADAL